MNRARVFLQAEDVVQTGAGIGVAVLDTGVSPVADLTEPDNRLVAFKDIVNGRLRPYDDNGHGTHVAGIVAGNGLLSGGKYAGLAPGAHIVGVKILNDKGLGSAAQALAGLQWVLENRRRYSIRVVNLSIGANDRSANLPLVRALSALWDAGILVTVAAGNRDSASGAIAAPSQSRKIVIVGSYEDGLQPEPFRPPWQRTVDYGARTDLVAPGADVVSCLSPDFVFDGKARRPDRVIGGRYIPMTGTSMATPMVSAAVALLLEKEPSLRPEQLKARLKKSAVLVTPPGVKTPLHVLNLKNLLG